MSFNHGYPNSADRAALLSGLRGGYSAASAAATRIASSSAAAMNPQSFEDLQYMMLQQQMQFQQPLPFNNNHQQQQQQFQNPAQAQLFAIQQPQLELQLQQIQMANLALQEQILIQHQQQARSQPPAQQQQQQQAPSYGNLAALGAAAASRRATRSVSAGPAPMYNQPVVEDANNSWRQAGHVYSSPDTSYEIQAGNDLESEARYEARRGALQNLQQARQQRSQSPNLSNTSGVFSPPTANLDWQAQRMQYKSSGTPEAAVVVTPPAQIDSGKRDLTQGSGQQQMQQHRKNSSEVSDVSIQSLSISEAGSHVSPNRGPALVLSKPGDEFPEEEDDADESTDDGGPMSPSLNASMRAASIHSAFEQNNGNQEAEKRRSSSSGRHTVILSSSIVDLRRAAAANQSGRNSPFTDSDSSSTASSPTSDKSEVASFDSTSSTVATSLPNTSPTSINFDAKSITESEASLGLGRPPSALAAQSNTSQRRAVSAMVGSGPLNASASVFAPGTSKAYPSSLSVGSGSNTPLRLFSAPARNGSPQNVPTVLRQPKGPADEKDMAAKNFAGMIRRKAVGALRLAAASGARASPVSSPVLAGFPGNISQGSDGMSRFASPSNGLTSPLASQTSFNMSDLATRAMRRRSQQGGYAAYLENPGLGMTQ